MKKKKITKRIFAVFFAVLIMLSVFTLGIGAQDCTHPNLTFERVSATCTEEGYTFYSCPDCSWSEKNDWEREIGHNFVDGVCSVCGTLKPIVADGYYIFCNERIIFSDKVYLTYNLVENDLSVISLTDYYNGSVNSFEIIGWSLINGGYNGYYAIVSWSGGTDNISLTNLFVESYANEGVIRLANNKGFDDAFHNAGYKLDVNLLDYAGKEIIVDIYGISNRYGDIQLFSIRDILVECAHSNIEYVYGNIGEYGKHGKYIICKDCDYSPYVEESCTIKNDTCELCGFICVHTVGHTISGNCEYCGKYVGHTPGAVATCTTPQTCIECGDVLALAIGHDFDNGACRLCGVQCAHSNIEYVYGNIGEYGKHGKYIICKDCDYSPYVEESCTIKNDTCELCGFICVHTVGHTISGNCEYCGKYVGHTPGAVATCTTPQMCTDCHAILVSPIGHSPGQSATCTTPQTCRECDEVLALAIGHDFDNGACRLCGVQCAHSETEYLYTIHEYDENEGYAHKVETCCSICHALLDTDPWVECTFNSTQECICGRILLTCDHDFDNGACRLCGVQCAHSKTEYLYTIHKYDENEGYAHKVETCCSICHALLDTDPWVECTFNSTQECTFCGRACEHLVFVGGYCDGCGEECAHSYYLGSCRYCYKDCKHIFNGDDVRCTVCGYVDYYYIDGDNNLAFELIVSIYDGMAYVFNSMLDYNILGINIASLIISLASLAILAFVLKKVL